jgi:imidazoleglycerol phosphate synthase cyclase subunit
MIMDTVRVIPCLFLKHGMLVRSQQFRTHQAIGNPLPTIRRLSSWNVDELVLIDISDSDEHDMRRDDLTVDQIGSSMLTIIDAAARVAFMPMTVGGRIRTMEDIAARLAAGADKCMINTAAVEDPSLIAQAARRFGSQCIVVGIDAKRASDGSYAVWTHGATRPTGLSAADWVKRAEEAGAGELFLNSIDRDGTGEGYDIELVHAVTSATSIPVVACGGVGKYEHLASGSLQGGASAVAAANIFHFFELSYVHAKRACAEAGVAVRPATLGSKWCRREPEYTTGDQTTWQRRLERPRAPINTSPPRLPVRWCAKCVYPSLAAAPMEFDADGVCMGCRMAEAKASITPGMWRQRFDVLRAIADRARCTDGTRYDCVIPVSGGKDSYFQTHVITRELGLRPLLVTYNGNNYTPAGWRNVQRMKDAFGVDHVIFSPSSDLLVRLNRLAFQIMGDMNWHAHVGITTYPVRVAAQHKIPLVVWGEHGYLDLSGQFSMDDYPEMSYRDRVEHFARGCEWNFFVGLEGILAQDMIAYQYPSDAELLALDMRGIYLGNFVRWEANEHTQLMIDLYGWQPSDETFDRTYRMMSNLDDMHENGVHDYLKFIKFGYGRCTDHACKDIRAGLMTREDGIELVRQYDHVKPRDLKRWLNYAGMTEREFDRVADLFRDSRVWWREGGEWRKQNVWDVKPKQPAMVEHVNRAHEVAQ